MDTLLTSLSSALHSYQSPLPLYVTLSLSLLLIAAYVTIWRRYARMIKKYRNYLRYHEVDEQTGLKNMTYFLQRADEAIAELRERRVPAAFFYTDLTHFHRYNMTYGFEMGNRLLQRIARELRLAFPNSLVCRISADHFAGIVPLESCRVAMLNVRAALQPYARREETTLVFGLYAIKPQDVFRNADDVMRGLERAVTASHFAEGQDSGDIVFFDKELEEQERVREHVIKDIDVAVEQRWLRVYYQPIIDVRTEQLFEYEALARWQDPEFGFLPPYKFIPALEEERTIYKVDTFILAQYGRDVEASRRAGEQVFPVSFNISRTDLEACDIYGHIEDIIARYRLPRELVHVEITESALNGWTFSMQKAVRRFHELGLEVWMDDFGSGYSSLNTLKDYDFDVVKIDMDFLRNFNEKSQTIIRSVCRMCRELGIRTVAEGVETREQFAFLQDAGCDYAQGYLFSRPLPLEEVRAKMRPYYEGAPDATVPEPVVT